MSVWVEMEVPRQVKKVTVYVLFTSLFWDGPPPQQALRMRFGLWWLPMCRTSLRCMEMESLWCLLCYVSFSQTVVRPNKHIFELSGNLGALLWGPHQVCHPFDEIWCRWKDYQYMTDLQVGVNPFAQFWTSIVEVSSQNSPWFCWQGIKLWRKFYDIDTMSKNDVHGSQSINHQNVDVTLFRNGTPSHENLQFLR